jgi:hypothetical protein
MHCMICHNEYVPFIAKNQIQKKSYIMFQIYWNNYLIKPFRCRTYIVYKCFWEEVNNFMKSSFERQLAKKWLNVSINENFKFFLLKTF